MATAHAQQICRGVPWSPRGASGLSQRVGNGSDRMTDQELIQALQDGDSEAMRQLAERFSRRVFKYLYGWVKNREDALDLTQEVLMRVYQKADLFKGDSSLEPWIFKIARNLFHDHLRRRNHKVHSCAQDLSECLENQLSQGRRSDPEGMAIRVESAERVRQAILKLPKRQREVVQLRLLAEMKLEEIACALDISLGGVKSTLHNALSRLRQELSDLREGAHV